MSLIDCAASKGWSATTPSITGICICISGRLCGGSLTTGRAASKGSGGRDIADPEGDTIKSLPISGAIEERRLIPAILGE